MNPEESFVFLSPAHPITNGLSKENNQLSPKLSVAPSNGLLFHPIDREDRCRFIREEEEEKNVNVREDAGVVDGNEVYEERSPCGIS